MKKMFIFLLLGISLMCTLSACTPSNSNLEYKTSETTDNSSDLKNETTEVTDHNSEITPNTSHTNMENTDEISTTETVVITDINLEYATIMIGESLDTDYELQTRIQIKEYTQILINGTPCNLTDLSVGTHIKITYTGGILESAPSQIISPLQIEVMD